MIAIIIYTYLFLVNLLAYVGCAADQRSIEFGTGGVSHVMLSVIGCLGGAYGSLVGALFFGCRRFKAWYYIVVGFALIVWLVGMALLSYYN